jgi:hypothetical protein
VLAAAPAADVFVFVVWVPILKTDGTPDAETLALVADSRAVHFWDEAGVVSPPFKDLLELPGRIRAWDLYMLFGRGTTWAATPPMPVYWQHQLGEEVEGLAPKLDTEALRQRVKEMAGFPAGPNPA